jgi:hypothetical protein
LADLFIPDFGEPCLVILEPVILNKIAQIFEEKADVLVFEAQKVIWEIVLID